MTIHNKHAFEDAQIMAYIAVAHGDQSFWAAAMLALKEAYKG